MEMARWKPPVFLVLGLWLVYSTPATGHMEHKVHNIVLYPDKHSWCKTTVIKQVVAYPGCDSVEMDNNVCVGACFSYSIPRTLPSSPGEVLPYCDSCQPSNTTIKHVTLKCTSGEFEGEIMTKTVEIITNCSCMTCSDPSARSPLFEDDEDLNAPDSDSLLDVPQLLGLVHSSRDKNVSTPKFHNNFHTHNHSNHGSVNETVINERLLLLLRELNGGVEEVGAPNQVALRELLSKVENDDHKVDDATLTEFVQRVEKEGHINIDVERLRNILIKLESADRHTKIGHRLNVGNAHRHHQHMHSGPHHSSVLVPDESHDMIDTGVYLAPTLDVASHHLKPALAGSELSYHDNLVATENEEETPPTHPSEIDQD